MLLPRRSSGSCRSKPFPNPKTASNASIRALRFWWYGPPKSESTFLGAERCLSASRLFRDEQALRDRPLLVYPLLLTAEAAVCRHLLDFLGAIFVGALGPDRFVRAEENAASCFANGHRLRAHRTQVHLDPPLL